jgi:hypothetical protein
VSAGGLTTYRPRYGPAVGAAPDAALHERLCVALATTAARLQQGDDTQALMLVAKCAQPLLCRIDGMRDRNARAIVMVQKSEFRNPYTRTLPRVMCVQRLVSLHARRLGAASHSLERTPASDRLLTEMASMAIGSYSVVRTCACNIPLLHVH